MQVARQSFYPANWLANEVSKKVAEVIKRGENIDYLAFVPDGEPTLDSGLGDEIELLRPLGFKLAVLTNASLLWNEKVRNDLLKADWVSLKVDALSEEVWHKINRPHKSLKFDLILEGMRQFGQSFKGQLTTETMLIQGINDAEEELEKIADFLAKLKPSKAYLTIPIRPPAEKEVRPASEEVINLAYQIFSRNLSRVEYLLGYEGNAFAFTGDVEDDLLSITAVHPMREEGLNEFLAKAGADWGVVRRLIKEGKLVEVNFQGNKFYLRKLPGRVALK